MRVKSEIVASVGLTPSEAFEAIADIIAGVCRQPFRKEAVMPFEWDIITDKILSLAESEKQKSRALARQGERG